VNRLTRVSISSHLVRPVHEGDTETPLAAAGLVIIMIGATVVTAIGGAIAPALFPLAVGLLSGFIAYGRWPVHQLAR